MNKYNFGQYLNIERWSSYWHQLDEILACQPKSVFEIGVGDKVVGDYLKVNFPGIIYQGLDNDEKLRPDILDSIENYAFPAEQYDVICAFEVLEHLPFEKFTAILLKLKQASREYVIISLPHWGRHFSLEVRLPFFGKLTWQYKCKFLPIEHKFDGQHFWEIGKNGYSLEKVKENIARSGLKTVKDFIAFESPYHHFFILKK